MPAIARKISRLRMRSRLVLRPGPNAKNSTTSAPTAPKRSGMSGQIERKSVAISGTSSTIAITTRRTAAFSPSVRLARSRLHRNTPTAPKPPATTMSSTTLATIGGTLGHDR